MYGTSGLRSLHALEGLDHVDAADLAGEEALHALAFHIPVLSQLFCALVGLIPNCAVSVVLTELYLEGVLSAGALLAGLLPGAGVGILVLLRTNKNAKENLFILSLLVVIGFVFGLLFDLTGISGLLTV